MKPYQILRDAHDLLTAYQRERPEPLASIARIVTAIEEELQQFKNPEPLYDPTVYVGTQCEFCGNKASCLSVLCSQKIGGHYVSGNKMVCINCLIKNAIPKQPQGPGKCPLCGGEVWTQEELDATKAQAEVWYKLFHPVEN